MNSAAKILDISQGYSRPFIGLASLKIANTPYQWAVQIALMLLLVSSLLLVISSNQTRSLYRQQQVLQAEKDSLHTEHGKLLLEKSTLLTQARIEERARVDYGMQAPSKTKMLVLL